MPLLSDRLVHPLASSFVGPSVIGLLLAGCGNVRSTGAPDGAAGGDDAMIGSGTATSGPVTIIARRPVAGTMVLLSRPDGTMIAETTLGADGTVVLPDVPRGSMVTLGWLASGARQLTSVADLEPGDQISFGAPPFDDTPHALTFDPKPPLVLSHFVVGTGCWNIQEVTSVPVQISAFEGCRKNGQWTLAAIGFCDSTRNSPCYFTVAAANSDTPQLTSWQEGSSLASLSVAFSNAPPGTSSVRVSFEFPYPTVEPSFQSFTASSGTARFRFPPGLVDPLVYVLTAETTIGPNLVAGSSFRRSFAPRAEDSINIGLNALSPVTRVLADFADPSRPMFSWMGIPAESEAQILSAAWSGDGSMNWSVVVSPSTSSIHFPEIPASHTELAPPVGAQWHVQGSVSEFEVTGGGWSEARQDPASAVESRASYRSYYIDHL